MKQKTILCILLFFLFGLGFPTAWAETGESTEEGTSLSEEYYEEQLGESGAEELPEKLDQETREQLSALGIRGVDLESLTSLSPETLFSSLGKMTQEASGQPVKVLAMLLSIILLSALVGGMRTSLDSSVAGTAALTGVLCVCMVLVQPVVSFISQAETVIRAGAGFMLACVPVLAGIMLASGQAAASASFHLLTTAAGNAVTLICAGVLVPLMNTFLGVSIVSSISPEMKLDGLCNAFSKVIKWILGLSMTVFTGLLTIHGIVTAATDSAAGRAARFMVSSFVPIVGGALGEALGTVTSCVKMLKSGVTAFALLAECVIFLPSVLQCLLWQITVAICAGVSRMFGLSEMTSLLEAVGKVAETLQAILLCSMAVMTVTGTVMLMLGGGQGA